MSRVLALLTTAALTAASGCASYEYYGDDGYYSGYSRYPGDATGYHNDGSGYYAPSGRTYYDDSSYGYSTYTYPTWVDYPYYYSLFWPLQRTVIDPYWYPDFYYGVTWYPRNYFAISVGGSYYRPWYRPYAYTYLSYSPYRLSWVDYCYDWYPWRSRYYGGYDYNRWYAPRYGSARNEAERLARMTGANHRYGIRDDGLPSARWYDTYQPRSQVSAERESVRGADYYGRDGRRIDPGVRGFGVPAESNGRAADYGRGNGRIDPDVRGFGRAREGGDEAARGVGRVDPAVRGFGVPEDSRGRAADYGRAPPRDEAGRREFDASGRGGDDRRQAERVDPGVRGFGGDTGRDRRGEPPARVIEPEAGIPYPYSAPERTRGASTAYGRIPAQPPRTEWSQEPPRQPVERGDRPDLSRFERAAPAAEPRFERPRYSEPGPSSAIEAPRLRGGDYGRGAEVREQPRFEPREQPRFEARQEPRFEPREEPRFEPRAEPRFERREEPRFESREEPPSFDSGDSDRSSGDGGVRGELGRFEGR